MWIYRFPSRFPGQRSFDSLRAQLSQANRSSPLNARWPASLFLPTLFASIDPRLCWKKNHLAADRNQFLETETISTSSSIFRSAQPSKYGILLFNYARFLLASTISFFFSFCKLSIFFFYGSLSVRYVKPVVFKFSSCYSRECEFSCFC